MSEYEEQLSNFYSPAFAENVIKTILNLPEIEETIVYFRWKLIQHDANDDKFADAAVSSNTDWIVTHDGDFKVLNKVTFPIIKCITLQDFHLLFFGVPMPE